MERLPSVASRRISGQFSNRTKPLGWIVISNGRSNGPCSWVLHSRRSAVQPRKSLVVTRPTRKMEVFGLVRAGLTSRSVPYRSGPRVELIELHSDHDSAQLVRPACPFSPIQLGSLIGGDFPFPGDRSSR